MNSRIFLLLIFIILVGLSHSQLTYNGLRCFLCNENQAACKQPFCDARLVNFLNPCNGQCMKYRNPNDKNCK